MAPASNLSDALLMMIQPVPPRGCFRSIMDLWRNEPDKKKGSVAAQGVLWHLAERHAWSNDALLLLETLSDMALDVSWNFFVQLLLCLGPWQQQELFFRALGADLWQLATHQQGCRSVIRVLEHQSSSAEAQKFITRFEQDLSTLAFDDWGIYIVKELLRRIAVTPGMELVLTACCLSPLPLHKKNKRNHALSILSSAVDFNRLDERHASMLARRPDLNTLGHAASQGRIVAKFISKYYPAALNAEGELDALKAEAAGAPRSLPQAPEPTMVMSLRWAPVLVVGSVFSANMEPQGMAACWCWISSLHAEHVEGTSSFAARAAPVADDPGLPSTSGSNIAALQWSMSKHEFLGLFRGGPIITHVGESLLDGVLLGLEIAAISSKKKGYTKPDVFNYRLALKVLGGGAAAPQRPLLVQFGAEPPVMHDFSMNHICVSPDVCWMVSTPPDTVVFNVGVAA